MDLFVENDAITVIEVETGSVRTTAYIAVLIRTSE